MTIQTECKLRDFEFWGGGKVRANKLTPEELDQLETIIDPTGMGIINATELNDYLWFEEEDYVPLLGISEKEWEER